MIEFFKILIEEPAKLRKLGLFIVKFFLNIYFVSKVYLWTIGQFEVISFSDFKALEEFLLSGKILICIILYIFSEVVLFNIVASFSTVLLDWIAKKCDISKPDFIFNKFFNWSLKKSGVIQYNKDNEVKAGDNIDAIYEFLELYNKKEVKDEIHSLKNSFVNKVMSLYFVFVLVYIFLLDITTKNNGLNYIILAGCIILPVLYIEVCLILEFLHKNGKDLLFGINRLRFEKLIIENLKEIGIYPIIVENPKEMGYNQTIFYKEKEYILEYHYGKHLIHEFLLNNYKDTFIKAEKKMILITNNDLNMNAKELADEFKKSLVIIKFENEADLVNKLENSFRDK